MPNPVTQTNMTSFHEATEVRQRIVDAAKDSQQHAEESAFFDSVLSYYPFITAAQDGVSLTILLKRGMPEESARRLIDWTRNHLATWKKLDDRIQSDARSEAGNSACPLDDGFWYYDTKQNPKPLLLSAVQLRHMADELDSLNARWRDDVHAFMHSQQQYPTSSHELDAWKSKRDTLEQI